MRAHRRMTLLFYVLELDMTRKVAVKILRKHKRWAYKWLVWHGEGSPALRLPPLCAPAVGVALAARQDNGGRVYLTCSRCPEGHI